MRQILFVLWLATSAVAATEILHVSDSHVANFEGVKPALRFLRLMNAGSLGLLERFVAAANSLPAVHVIHTGDIVDATCFDSPDGTPIRGQIPLALRTLAQLRHPYHLALGNHDVECYRHDSARPGVAIGDHSVADEARREWGAAYAPMRRSSYYSAALTTRYRLVVLDNGQEWSAAGKAFFAKQMAWLDEELRRHRGVHVLIAMHIPLAANERSDELLRVLRRHANIRAILCGHQHSDDVSSQMIGNQRVYQIRTAALNRGGNTWRRLRLLEDRMEVYATGEPEQLLESIELPSPPRP
jgi:3',5'-cyclic AMP phosphodiesterase CpdA